MYSKPLERTSEGKSTAFSKIRRHPLRPHIVPPCAWARAWFPIKWLAWCRLTVCVASSSDVFRQKWMWQLWGQPYVVLVEKFQVKLGDAFLWSQVFDGGRMPLGHWKDPWGTTIWKRKEGRRLMRSDTTRMKMITYLAYWSLTPFIFSAIRTVESTVTYWIELRNSQLWPISYRQSS